MIPDWQTNARLGVAWERDSMENLKKLIDLSERTCPEYLKRPNDSAAIQSFVKAKAQSLDHTPEVKKNGHSLLHFLQTELASTQPLFSPMGISFFASSCGSLMIRLHKESKQRLKQIEEKSEEIAKKCLGNASLEASAHLKAATEEKVHAIKRNGAAPPKQNTSAPPSDITGLKPPKAGK